MIKMRIYGHTHHGTSRFYTSAQSLRFLHYLWPVAIGSVNRIEAYTSLYNLYLELACKDAVSSQLFKYIDDMLLSFYYLYQSLQRSLESCQVLQKMLRKCLSSPKVEICQLDFTVADESTTSVQYCKDLSTDMVCTSVTLWHLLRIKPSGVAKRKRYFQKWRHTRMLFGAALYVDVLNLHPVKACVSNMTIWTLSMVLSQCSNQASHSNPWQSKTLCSGRLPNWFVLGLKMMVRTRSTKVQFFMDIVHHF